MWPQTRISVPSAGCRAEAGRVPDPTATGPSRLEGGNGWAVEGPLGSAERAAHPGVVCHEAGKVTAADASSGVGGRERPLTGAPRCGSNSGKVRSREHAAATWQLLALQGPPFTRCLPAPLTPAGQLSVDTPPWPQGWVLAIRKHGYLPCI